MAVKSYLKQEAHEFIHGSVTAITGMAIAVRITAKFRGVITCTTCRK